MLGAHVFVETIIGVTHLTGCRKTEPRRDKRGGRHARRPVGEGLNDSRPGTHQISVLPAQKEEAMSLRPTKQTIQTTPTIEGAGVKLQRAFGFGKTKDFDPFLLLDDFRNDNPDAR